MCRLCLQMLTPSSPCNRAYVGNLADAGAPTVLAPAPDAVILADAGIPAVLALAPLAGVLALLAPPLRCALLLPLHPPFPPRLPPLLDPPHRRDGLLPRRAAVSPLLAALGHLPAFAPDRFF
jgi:hypothetical protein